MAQTHSLDLEAGSSQYAYINDAAAFDLGSHSIEAWVRLESLPSGGNFSIVQKYVSSGNQRSYAFYITDDGGTLKLAHTVSGDGTANASILGTFPFLTGVCYHVAVTYASGTGATVLYVNGRVVGSGNNTQTSVFNSTAPLQVGAGQGTSSPDSFFDGLIKDVRLFNDVRSASEVAADAHTEDVSDANLVAEWNFNNSYSDSSGNGHTLTASGSPTFSTTVPWTAPTDVSGSTPLTTNLVSYYEMEEASGTRADSHGTNDLTDNNTVGSATGKISNAADFEAANSEYLSIADASQTGLDFTTAFTISAWINLESEPAGANYFRIVSKGNTGAAENKQYALLVGNSDTLALQVSEDGTAFTLVDTAFAPSLSAWYHIVVTWDGGQNKATFYVNGVQQGADKAPGVTDIPNGNRAFHIGASDDAGTPSQFFDGLIDEVAIYSRALHYGEILDLYNAGAGIPYAAINEYVLTLDETVTLTDTIAKGPGRLLAETIALTDDLLRSLAKSCAEVVTYTDTFARAIGRAFADTVTHTDILAKGTARSILDTVTLTDTTTTVTGHNYTANETVTLSDTLLRQASRILDEAITFSDTMARATTRALSETVILTDNLLASMGRQLSEAVTLTDTMMRQIAHDLAESITFHDTVTRAVSRVFSETIAYSDALMRSTGRILVETATVSDVLIRQSTRALMESLSLMDTIAAVRARFRTFTDTVTLTDTFAYRILTRMKKGIALLTTSTKKTVLESKDDPIIL